MVTELEYKKAIETILLYKQQFNNEVDSIINNIPKIINNNIEDIKKGDIILIKDNRNVLRLIKGKEYTVVNAWKGTGFTRDIYSRIDKILEEKYPYESNEKFYYTHEYKKIYKDLYDKLINDYDYYYVITVKENNKYIKIISYNIDYQLIK